MRVERGSRWQTSVTTFGPVGRVVVTALLLAVLAWFLLYAGVFGLVGAVVWVGWVLPRALRDVWRRAELPATGLTRLRDETRREQPQEKATHLLFRDVPGTQEGPAPEGTGPPDERVSRWHAPGRPADPSGPA